MKKVLALMLCIATLVSCMVGCEFDPPEKKQEDKGATVNLYMSTEVYNFDPVQAYIDEASQQLMGLLYEGLFTLNKNGKRVKAGASSYKIVDNEKEHFIEIKLRKSFWSDGRQVQAADYVYAFKRALETESTNEAAAMLMDIKNAYDIKHAAGDKPLSIDDLGVTDEGIDVLKISFAESIDFEQFLDYLASPLLVPLREDVVNKAAEWASNSSIVTFNGPFFIRNFTPGDILTLERNSYYDRDIEEDSVKKAVTPYRIVINFKLPEGQTDLAQASLDAFLNGEIDYLGDLPLSARTSMADQIKVIDTETMSQLSVLFNTKDEVVGNAKVRKALSMALDRTKIAELLVFASPATNLIGDGVYETTYKNKTLFKEVSGELFAATANTAAAQSLLKEAGVTSGKITITHRPTEADTAVFNYIKGVWEDLGFTVESRNDLTFDHEVDANEYDLYWNEFYHAYAASDFQVMLYDMLTSSNDPFSILAPFALDFSGNKAVLASLGNVETGDTEVTEDGEIIQTPHVSGFNNDTYNKLIADAWAIKSDNAERSALLHEAEKLLAEECPVVPLIEYQRYYVVSDNLSGLKTAGYGITDFRKMKLKTYDPETEAPVEK